MRVCHLVSGDLWAGAEVQAYSLIKGLSKLEGILVEVITFNEGILSSKLRKDGISLDIVPESETNVISMIQKIVSILWNKKTDILHTHGFKENFIGGIAAKLCLLKAVVRTHHGQAMLKSKGLNGWIEKINAHLLTKHHISVSEDLREFLKKNGYEQSKITMIHNGIDFERMDLGKGSDFLRKDFNIGENITVIGTIGRMEAIKGHKYFIEGAGLILEKEKNVCFVIVGDGALMEEMRNYAEKLNITQQIRFAGFRHDSLNCLNMFDIFALTSLHEGIPITLLEAMSLGKPIVATNVGGIPEVIENNYSGVLIPPEDPYSFAEACVRLANDSSLRERLSVKARAEVRRRFSLETNILQTIQLYKSLI
jgi:glycosyltransferase involved in cell wall biosynthesis